MRGQFVSKAVLRLIMSHQGLAHLQKGVVFTLPKNGLTEGGELHVDELNHVLPVDEAGT